MDRNKTQVYKPNYQDSVNGRGQIGTEEAPWAEGWFSALRYLVQPGGSYTATDDITFTDSKAPVTIFTVDPNGANRKFTPSGTFRDRSFVIVINTGVTNNVTFTVTGIDGRITPGKTGMFVYLGSTAGWKRMLF